MPFDTDEEVRIFLQEHAEALGEPISWDDAKAERETALDALRIDLTRKLEPLIRARSEANRLRRVWAGWAVLYEETAKHTPYRPQVETRLKAADKELEEAQRQASDLESKGDNAYWLGTLRRLQATPNESQ